MTVDPFRQFARFQTARGGLASLPSWARSIVTLLALPGLALVALSICALCVSILALLLLTVPAYRVLQALTGTRPAAPAGVDPGFGPAIGDLFGTGGMSPGRRQVDARVVDGDGPR